MITRPAVGSSNPAMMLKIVLLPQPDGPIRLTKRPCGIARVTGASAWKAPAIAPVWNVMLTLSTQSFGAGMHAPATEKIPSRLDYIAKAMPATIAVYARERWEISVPRRDPLAANYSKRTKFRQCTSCAHGVRHFAPTVDARRMVDQRAVSDFTKASNFAGVRSALGGIVAPSSDNRFTTVGSSRLRSRAAASLSTISLGVPLGAKMPAQMLM